jgi:hypothetical protein
MPTLTAAGVGVGQVGRPLWVVLEATGAVAGMDCVVAGVGFGLGTCVRKAVAVPVRTAVAVLL